jgi:hypothetical protein
MQEIFLVHLVDIDQLEVVIEFVVQNGDDKELTSFSTKDYVTYVAYVTCVTSIANATDIGYFFIKLLFS